MVQWIRRRTRNSKSWFLYPKSVIQITNVFIIASGDGEHNRQLMTFSPTVDGLSTSPNPPALLTCQMLSSLVMRLICILFLSATPLLINYSATVLYHQVLKRVVVIYLLTYFRSRNLISRRQHGFLSIRSTTANLVESFCDWSPATNCKNSADFPYISILERHLILYTPQ